MVRGSCVFAFPVFVAFALIVGLAFVQPLFAGLTGPETALDTRIKQFLVASDTVCSPLAENPAYPTPNNELSSGYDEEAYLTECLSIFGMIDMGAASASRIPEANRYLRYAFLGKWPAPNAQAMVGQYAPVWNHRARSLAMRLYCAYKGYMEPDIRAEFDKRVDWLCVAPYTSSSENIRWSNNSAYFLSYEATGRTGTSGFADVKQWVVSQLKTQGNEGPSEWGSFYNGWTYSAILNLADFAQDTQVKKLAEMAWDMWLARCAIASYQGKLATGGVRCYPWWIHGTLRFQTAAQQLMMVGNPEQNKGDLIEFALTNYRAPTTVVDIAKRTGEFESWVKTWSGVNLRHYHYHSDKFCMGINMAPEGPDIFHGVGGGTHDISGIYIQSSKGRPSTLGTGSKQSMVTPCGYRPEKPPAKRINMVERYFGYKHVAMCQHGGTTKAVYASGTFTGVPIRLFATKDYSVEFDSGWAFLTNGETFVAWAPTQGDPEADPESTKWYDPNKYGFCIRSSYVGDDNGEVAVLDAGDAASYGSYANFKTQVKSRNPRPRWVGNKVSYTARDGTVVEFSDTYGKINGTTWDRATAPGTQGPGLSGNTITQGGANIAYDFNGSKTTGSIARVASNMTFGGVTGTQPAPLAISTSATMPQGTVGAAYASVTLAASGGTAPYLNWRLATGSTLPAGLALSGAGVVSGTPTAAGTSSATISVSDSTGASASKVFSFDIIAGGGGVPTITTNATLPVGDVGQAWGPVTLAASGGTPPYTNWVVIGTDPLPPGITLTGATGTLSGIPTQDGTFQTRIRVLDSASPTQVNSKVFTFEFNPASGSNQLPLAADELYVDSTDAQGGTTGNPVTGIDLTPVFSAVYDDPDAGDTSDRVYIQVSTDDSFATVDAWNSGVMNLTAPVTQGNRCADIVYAGNALNAGTIYYWRMIFIDVSGGWGALHTDEHSFQTAAAANNAPLAPTALFVGNTSAQTGSAGTASAPATGLDLDPVFSAVFEDSDAGDSTQEIWMQVGTDPAFATGLLWFAADLQGATSGAIAVASCAPGARCADFDYAGGGLSPNMQYYWRMLFVDAAGVAGAISETGSFITDPGATPAPLVISTTLLGTATIGVPYAQPLTATGGQFPYVWSLTGVLPTGISLDPTGNLFGTPDQGTEATYPLQITVTDAASGTQTATLSLTVAPPIGQQQVTPPKRDAGAGGCALIGGREVNFALVVLLMAVSLAAVARLRREG